MAGISTHTAFLTMKQPAGDLLDHGCWMAPHQLYRPTPAGRNRQCHSSSRRLLFVLAGLMAPQVTLALLVLVRAGKAYNSGVCNATTPQHQATATDVNVVFVSNCLTHELPDPKRTNAKERGLVRHEVGPPRTEQTGHLLNFVERLRYFQIGEGPGKIQKIDSKRLAQRLGRPRGPALGRASVETVLESLPRRQLYHSLPQYPAPGRSLLALAVDSEKTHQIHVRRSNRSTMAVQSQIRRLIRDSLIATIFRSALPFRDSRVCLP
jgi:hypothetical protein